MKKLLLLSIIIVAQQYAAETIESSGKKPVDLVPLKVFKYNAYAKPGGALVLVKTKTSKDTAITATKASKIVAPKEAPSNDVAFIIEKTKDVIQNKWKYKPQAIQQAKNECLRLLKKTANPVDRARLAEAHSKFY